MQICATCFDISVGLLRVLEMIVTLAPELLTDSEDPAAELLLSRLFQVSLSFTSRERGCRLGYIRERLKVKVFLPIVKNFIGGVNI